MSDNEQEYSEEEDEEEQRTTEKRKDEPPPKTPEISEAELAMEKMRKKKEEEEAYWTEYMDQRKKQRLKEEDELKKLKDRQLKRKERRKEEEKKFIALKKHQEAQRVKEMEEKKQREAEAKKRRLEEAERKRQAMQDALQRNKIQEPITPNFVISKRSDDPALFHPALEKFPTSLSMRNELAKTKEQLMEDKKAALMSRVKALDIEYLSVTDLRHRAQDLWAAIVRLESENYDLEVRRERQEYDLKELSERQRQINRSRALKKGLDPDALSGKFPPMINVASKYERRLDRRCFTDKKSLFEGGYVSQVEANTASEWENKLASFKDRGPSKLPRWDPNNPKTKERPDLIEDDDELPLPDDEDMPEREIIEQNEMYEENDDIEENDDEGNTSD